MNNSRFTTQLSICFAAALLFLLLPGQAAAQYVVVSSAVSKDNATNQVRGVSETSMDYHTQLYYQAQVVGNLYASGNPTPVSSGSDDSAHGVDTAASVTTQVAASPNTDYTLQSKHGLLMLYQNQRFRVFRCGNYYRWNDIWNYMRFAPGYDYVWGASFKFVADPSSDGCSSVQAVYFGVTSATHKITTPPPPTAPSNLKLSFISTLFAARVDLDWNDNSTNETGFKLERCEGAGCTNFTQIATIIANIKTFRDTTVRIDTPYNYRIRAYNDGGHSAYSNVLSVTPQLEAPTDLEVGVEESSSKLRLQWKYFGTEQSYYSIERSTDETNWRHVRNVDRQLKGVIDSPVDAGTKYYYRVRAYTVLGGGGYSAYSNVASATTNFCNFEPLFCPTCVPPPDPFNLISGLGWTGTSYVSEDDGLEILNVTLNHRLLAKTISVPYYYLETTKFGPTRGELKPNGGDILMRSRLISLKDGVDYTKYWIEAVYTIDRLPNNSTSCLQITQRYEFYNQVDGERCEPSGTLPCARMRPIVKYEFRGHDGEQLKAINIPQRTHYNIDGIKRNTVGLFADCDIPLRCVFNQGSIGFNRKDNPLNTEIEARAIIEGRKGDIDNHHQTWDETRVGEPGEGLIPLVASRSPVRPGCPECVHSHWRWGWFIPLAEGGGDLIRVHPNSRQDMDLAIVKYRNGEEDPLSYKHLLNPLESIQRVASPDSFVFVDNGTGGVGMEGSSRTPEEVVYWLSATGKQPEDTFYEFGLYFNPAFKDSNVNVLRQAQGGNGSLQALSSESEDQPISVTFADLYAAGETRFADLNPTTVAPLPSNYSLHNNAAFNIESTAVTSGQHLVTFSVPSATDSTLFSKLRILHAEPDALDKDKLIWVDRTVLSPNSPAPGFSNKTISARVGFLGAFYVGVKSNAPLPPVNAADLVLTGSRSPEQLVAGDNITYTFNVVNQGPQMAATSTCSTSCRAPSTLSRLLRARAVALWREVA